MLADANSDESKRKASGTILAMEALVLVTSKVAAEIHDLDKANAGEAGEAAGSDSALQTVGKLRPMNRIQLKGRASMNGAPETYCVQILHLEDSPFDAALILDLLEGDELACEITPAMNRSDFEAAVMRQPFDVILCDHRVPGYSGFDALEFAKEHQPQVPVIIVSGALDDEQAVQSLKLGATDYILKERLARLVPAIRRALDEADDQIIKAAAEEKFREQAELLNLMRDAILVRNMNDKIVYWNPGAENLFGWTAEEAVGQDFMRLLAGDPVRLGSARESLLRSGDWLGEIQLKGKTGQKKTVISRWNLVRGKDGKPLSILSTHTDVSEIKKSRNATRQ